MRKNKRRINVIKGENRSPYIVNLKNTQQQLKKLAPTDRIKKALDAFITKKEVIKDKGNLIKSKAKTEIQKKTQVIKTIHKISKTHKRVETPLSVLVENLALTKKIARVWRYWVAQTYRNYKHIANDLAIFSLFIFLAKIILFILEYIYLALYHFGRIITQSLQYIWKIIPLRQTHQALHRIVIQIKVTTFKYVNFINHTLKSSYKTVAQTSQDASNLIQQTSQDTVARAKKFNISFKYLPPNKFRKKLLAFIVLSALLILPIKTISTWQLFSSIKGRVLGISEQAVADIKSASSQTSGLNFVNAASDFSEATKHFSEAQELISDYSGLIAAASIVPSSKIKAANEAKKLLESGIYATKIAEKLSLAFSGFESDSDLPLTDKIRIFSEYGSQALADLEPFITLIKSIDTDVISNVDNAEVAKLVAMITALQKQADMLNLGLSELVSLAENSLDFLGDKKDMRYLVVFQNNSEMRASGGFIGSFALVDFKQGEIKNIETPSGGSYDLQGGLHKRISAPQPLHLINSLWEFQDANWWPDWPTSAKKLAWFFENGWGSSVDGVISLTPTAIENLLTVFGPLDMTEKYGVIVTENNFYEVAQDRTNLADVNKPKEIITDLVNQLVTEMPNRVNSDNIFSFIKVINQSLLEKHILLNLTDDNLQNIISDRGWDGRILKANKDYLAVINTNIAGGKSDRKIRQTIEHQATVTPDGSIINEVTITRTHTGQRNEVFSGVRNVNYLRVYVPKGSQLIDASGFWAPDPIYFDDPAVGAEDDLDVLESEKLQTIDEATGVTIYNEFDKTVFAHWSQVDPGNSAVLYFKYKLPFKLDNTYRKPTLLSSLVNEDYVIDSYSLLVQKQLGSIASNFSSQLFLPNSMNIVQRDGDDTQTNWDFIKVLTQDAYFGAIIKID